MFRSVRQVTHKCGIVHLPINAKSQPFKIRIRWNSNNSSPNPDKATRRHLTSEKKKRSYFPVLGSVLAVTGGVGYAVYDIQTNPDGFFAKLYYNSIVQSLVNQLLSFFKDEVGLGSIFEPSSDKLLPDWGSSFYANVPPGTPPPPLLVVDLERTLIGSEYDAVHGWRHVKRPGLDKFIRDLSSYYEIVIFSENDIGATQEILLHIDPEGRCHKLGSNSAEIRGNTVIKRLDYMNRDLSRIILIDDDPESSQLFPRNTLHIKPFTNIQDKNDTVLYDLIPLLQAFVHEDCRDFRDTIDRLGTHEAEEVAIEYKMRLAKKKQLDAERRNKGIGGLIRTNKEEIDDYLPRTSILKPSDIVGKTADDAAEAVGLAIPKVKMPGEEEKQAGHRKKGKIFDYLDQKDKEKEEADRKKMELWTTIQNKRMAAMQQQQQGQQPGQQQP